MAGQRLLDAAKLFNAGTHIAKQHFGLRRQQWDTYTRTSSLAKAVKNQTDRVTVTAGAAVELAKRLNENSPAWQQQRQDTSVTRQAAERQDHGQDSVVQAQAVNDALPPKQDQRSVVEDAQPQAQRIAEQQTTGEPSRRQAAVDEDDGSLSSLRKRELQRQAERQIPGVTADEAGLQSSARGQDTYNVRPDHTSAELSSLPRSRIPKHAERIGGPITTGINPDTYPAPGVDQAPEDLQAQLFSSPRVSRMLARKSGNDTNPFAGRQRLPPKPLPEMVAARERWDKEKAAAQPTPSSTPPTPNTDADVETQKLADSIARDAASQAEPKTSDTTPEQAEEEYQLRESRVPSSRFGRLWQYSGLATSMAFGAVGESFRRITGGGDGGSLMLSEGNMNRLVAKLSRMRGAALKLGQMISFQDSKMLPPTINAVLQRVQDSADYMPPFQRDQVLIENLGADWRNLFSHFEERPFAAASIGQVHKATLKSNGKEVAVKVQYPGVRNSIDSDLNNLSLLLTASRLLPRGMFLDKTIANARTELGWECDYEREAKACQRFRKILGDEQSIFVVPEVFTEASGPGVLTAEFMHGTAVTKMKNLTQHDRDWVGTQILRLCLRELMEWRFMQTDPNWTNFLYNQQSQKLELLDFGASREYPDEFVEPYVELLIAAQNNDREACRDLSIQLGYLTGQESQAMLKAHIDSVMTLAEPFVATAPDVYDFEDQTITDRVRSNIGLMLRERLAPPPEETYSLHRKLSGGFLLCARLKSKVKTRQMFEDAVKVWRGRAKKIENPSSA